MSSTDFLGDETWAGKPVARKIADAEPRQRVVVTGWICKARSVRIGPTFAYSCVLSDATGELGIVFVGRHAIPGMVPETRCTVEGTARLVAERLELWNPLYRFELEDGPGTGTRPLNGPGE